MLLKEEHVLPSAPTLVCPAGKKEEEATEGATELSANKRIGMPRDVYRLDKVQLLKYDFFSTRLFLKFFLGSV